MSVMALPARHHHQLLVVVGEGGDQIALPVAGGGEGGGEVVGEDSGRAEYRSSVSAGADRDGQQAVGIVYHVQLAPALGPELLHCPGGGGLPHCAAAAAEGNQIDIGGLPL